MVRNAIWGIVIIEPSAYPWLSPVSNMEYWIWPLAFVPRSIVPPEASAVSTYSGKICIGPDDIDIP